MSKISGKIHAEFKPMYLGIDMQNEIQVTEKPIDKYLYGCVVDVDKLVISESEIQKLGLSPQEFISRMNFDLPEVVVDCSDMERKDYPIDFWRGSPIEIVSDNGEVLADSCEICESYEYENLLGKIEDAEALLHIGTSLSSYSMDANIGYINGELSIVDAEYDEDFDYGIYIPTTVTYYMRDDFNDAYDLQDFVDKFISDTYSLKEKMEYDDDAKYLYENNSIGNLDAVIISGVDENQEYHDVLVSAVSDSIIEELNKSISEQGIDYNEEEYDI